MFKNLKDTMAAATDAAKNAPAAKEAAEAQATAAQAGLTEGTYDPNDPGFEPVEGITLDRYAALCKALASAGLKDEEQVDQWAQEQGLQAGQFKRVNDEFTNRMGTNRALTNRFGMIYAQG
jgi:hypothetical protein